jgi:hypothetical protein
VWDLKDQYQANGNNTWQEGDGNYEIGRSLRFRRSNSSYLNRTSVTPTDGRKATFSFWIKKGDVDVGTAESYRSIFYTGTPNSDGFRIGWARYEGYENNGIMLTQDNGSSASHVTLFSTDVFRDPAAWYHFVIRYDSTDPIPNSRAKIFVNGREISSFTARTNPASNHIPTWQANGYNAKIGRGRDDVNEYTDMYLTEVNFIDGLALDPSYFGYFDATTNIWQPKPYTGLYGNNGYYLPFTENNSSANLGRNFAGCNLLTYSEQFDNGAWSVTQGSVGANVTIAPNETTTADYLKGNGTNTFHYVNRNLTVLASTRYTFSVYCKKADYDFIQIGDQGTSGAYVYVNLNNGQISTFGSNNQSLYNVVATTQFVGAGWYRIICSLTTGSSQTTLTPIIILLDNTANSSFAGSTSAGTYIWGAHVNLGSTADRYIQTVASAPNTNWTTNNISLTAGATYDSMVDSPTNVFTSATDIGGVVPGNYCTLNPLFRGANLTLSNAHLTVNNSTTESTHRTQAATMGMTTGKWYWEVYANNSANVDICGVISDDFVLENYVGGSGSSAGWGYNTSTGSYYPGAGWSSSGTAPAHPSSGIIMVAFDADAKKMWFGKQGTWNTAAGGVGVPDAGTNPTFTYSGTKTVFFPAVSMYYNTGSWTFNFGQRPFEYTPPAGFKSLNTTNLQALGTSAVGNAATQANKWFDGNVYGGTGSIQTVTNSGFQPDLIWTKERTIARSWRISDSVRGSRVEQYTDTTSTEQTDGSVVQFISNGFILDNATGSAYNATGENYISHQWKQSPTAGFNIVSYTGNGANNRAISHNLGVVPEFIIVKDRDVAYNFDIYHKSTGISGTFIFDTDGTRNASAFGSTAPTSSNFFTQNNYTNTNNSKLIAYVWAGVPGFSSFGMYTGNSSANGPFIYTGFKPKFLLIKSVAAGGNWQLFDSVRDPINPAIRNLRPSTSDSENSAYTIVDFVSNGFKIRHNDSAWTINTSSTNFIYAAFADSPFGLNNRAR